MDIKRALFILIFFGGIINPKKVLFSLVVYIILISLMLWKGFGFFVVLIIFIHLLFLMRLLHGMRADICKEITDDAQNQHSA
jgi:hypothetical protein